MLNPQTLLVKRFLAGLITPIVLISNSTFALTSKTKHVIKGNAPYLTFDGEQKVDDTSELMWIAISDGEKVKKYGNDYDSSPSSPIVLPESVNNFEQIHTELSPYQTDKVSLLKIIKDKNYWKDVDGDEISDVIGGNFTQVIRNVDNVIVKRNDLINNCLAPYQITLESTSGQITTTYGEPNIGETFSGVVKQFYVKKSNIPELCWSQPNLSYEDRNAPAHIWQPDKGFKLQDINEPSANFPTTGQKGLFFDAYVTGATANDISYTKEPSDSAIDIKLKPTTNFVRVTLEGPSYGTSAQEAAKVKATIFKLYAKNYLIYSFKISHWYINGNNRAGGVNAYQAKAYCNSISTTNSIYRITSSRELTPDTEKLDVDEDKILQRSRRIGWGLWGEWGGSSYYGLPDMPVGS